MMKTMNRILLTAILFAAGIVFAVDEKVDDTFGDIKFKGDFEFLNEERVVPPPIAMVHPTEKVPVIDGVLDDAIWKESTLFTGFIDNTSRTYAAEQTQVYLAFDHEHLYIAMSSPGNNVKADDSYIILLKPAGRNDIVSFRIHANGSLRDLHGTPILPATATAAAKIVDGKWNCELSIKYPGIKARQTWSANFCRSTDSSVSSWFSLRFPDFKNLDPRELGYLIFTDNGLLVRINSLGEMQKGDSNLESTVKSRETKQSFVVTNMRQLGNHVLAFLPYMTEKDRTVEYLQKMGDRVSSGHKHTDLLSYAFINKGYSSCYYRSDFLPVGKNSPVLIKAVNFIDKKYLNIVLDTYGTTPADLARKAAVKVAISDKDKEIYRSQPVVINSQNIIIKFPLAKLQTGNDYVVVATVEVDGKTIATASKNIYYPDISRWMGNTLGISDKVPPPWSPVRASGNEISCWGRKYVFGPGNGFPAQIVTRDQSILAGPARLSFAGDQKKTAFESGHGKITEARDTHVVYRTEEKNGTLKIEYTSTVEYDGMMRIDFSLTPVGTTKIDKMTLDIPIKEEFARYIGYTESVGAGFSSFHYYGKLPEDEFKLPFLPFIWFGDDDRGLLWFCESAKNWRPEKPEKAITVIRKDGIVTLRLNIIERPLELKEKIAFTMGLQASPVRPMPDNWRTYVRDRYHLYDKDENIREIDRNAKLIFSAGPTTEQERIYSGYIPETLKPHAEKLKEIKTPGKLFCAYTFLNNVSTNVPEYDYFYDDWKISEKSKRSPYFLEQVFPGVKSWQDFIVWSYVKGIEDFDIDGVYYDLVWPYPTTWTKHGAYIGEDGKPGRFWPIFGVREIAKRTYTAFRERKQVTAILGHCSSNVIVLPILSFCDIAYDGEQYAHLLESYMDQVPLDRMRAAFTCRQFGMLPLFLPEIHRSGSEKYNSKDAAPTEEMLALFFLHDINIDRIWVNTTAFDKFHNAKMKFIGDDTGVEFIPYWDDGGTLKYDNDEIKVSAYVKNSELLLIISNFAKQTEIADVTVDFASRNINPTDFVAIDTVTDKPVALKGAGLHVPVPARSLRLVKLGLEDPEKIKERTAITKALAEFDTLSAGEKSSAASSYLKKLFDNKEYKAVQVAANLILNDDKNTTGLKATACYHAYYSCVRLADHPGAQQWGEKMKQLDKPGSYSHSRGLIFKATALLRQGKLDAALATLPETAVRQMGTLQSEAFRTVGEIYQEMKRYPEAIEEYQKAVDVTDNASLKAVGLLRKGKAFEAVGQYSEALREYAEACKYDNGYYKGNAVVNALLLVKNQPQDALPWIKILDEDKTITPYWKCRALMYAGMRLQELGKKDEAKGKFKAAMNIEGAPEWLKKSCLENLQ